MLAAPAVFGQAPETVFLEELTWTELRELLRSGKTTVILPPGGIVLRARGRRNVAGEPALMFYTNPIRIQTR